MKQIKINVILLFIALTYIFSQYDYIFSSNLGYIISFIVLVYASYIDVKLGIVTFFILGLIILMFTLTPKVKEGFTWSQDTIDKFRKFEEVKNPNMIFDLKELQKQASEEEVDILVKTGMWPWDPSIQKIFLEEVSKDPYVRADPQHMMNKSRSVFNEAAIKRILTWYTPEGKLLFHGIFVDNDAAKSSDDSTYAINSGLVGQNKDIIRCSSAVNSDSSMIRIHKTGINGIYNTETTETSPVDYNELPNIINGFAFVKNPCDPCVALNNPADYSCPFSMDNKISNIWQNLWGVKNTNIDPKKYPALTELKNELNTLL